MYLCLIITIDCACSALSVFPQIARDIFQALSRPFQDPFPNFQRHYLFKKNINIILHNVYDAVRGDIL